MDDRRAAVLLAETMRTFKDNAGRTWTLALNAWAMQRVKDLAKVDLLGDPGSAMQQLSIDPIQLCNVLYAALKPDLDKAGVSDEQFGTSMGAESLRAATDAMLEELVDFFLKYRPDLGRTAAATMEKIKQVEPAAAKLAMAKLAAMDVDAMVGESFSTAAPESSE